jgi:Fe-S cluster assembly iron-binding protein IscA
MMLTLTESAGAHLAELLTQAQCPDEVAVRIMREGEGWALQTDTARPGDETFEHEEKTVLVLDEEAATLLTDMTLDIESGETGPSLVLH